MSLTSHIAHLQAKHAELENALSEEMHRPLPDFFTIQDLKKQKLLIKAEISRLMNDSSTKHQDAS